MVREQRQALILLLIIPFGGLATYMEFRHGNAGMAAVLAIVTIAVVTLSLWFARKPPDHTR
jgi:hypothetical protein